MYRAIPARPAGPRASQFAAPFHAALMAAMLVLPLGACSLFEDEATAEEEAPEAPVEARRAVPMERINGVEIGRVSNGISVTVFGIAPGAGYGAPQLTPRRGGRPAPDGFVEYDFRAIPPDPGFQMPEGTLAVRELRADRLIPETILRGTAGLRIYSLVDIREVPFG
ncbi:MAG: hypothetical protein AAFV86_16770 [Pseudomonadota bacterium]